MMRKYVFLLLFFSSSIVANDADVLLEKRLSASTVSGKFKQVVIQDKRMSKSAGRFEMSRPSKFRWEIISPMPQLIVSNGKKLWVFDKDLEQVTIRTIDKTHKGTPALFLSGYDRQIAKQYHIQYTKKSTQEVFVLLPKTKDGTYQKIELIYQNGTIASLKLKDELGQTLILSFYAVRMNKPLNNSRFEFKPPKGVDIVTE